MKFVFRAQGELLLRIPTFLAGGTGRVLDMGCGAGRTSIMVARARPAARIVALDNFSATCIRDHGPARLMRNLQLAGVANRVVHERGDMRALPCPDESFDAAMCTYALDPLGPDIPRALAEARRVLRPGGQLLLGVILPNLGMTIAWLGIIWLRFPSRSSWMNHFRDAGLDQAEECRDGSGAWFLLRRPTVQEQNP